MKNILLALGLTIVAFINANAQHSHSHHTTPAQAPQTTPKATTAAGQLQLLYTHYLGIKDALVAGERAQAATHANGLSQTASLISYRDLSEGNINALRKDASTIADAKDLAAQRKAFSNLSNNISALAEKFKLSDKPVYQQYCPMAKGYWLSNEKEIRNPYYGSGMLTCGSVKNILSTNQHKTKKMKLLFIGVAAVSAILFSACNSNADKTTDHSAMNHNMDTMKDMPMHSSTASNAAATSMFSEVFAHYQHLTFALSNDDSKEAANGAKSMGEALAKVDKSGFTTDQQKDYADLEADMKEHTEHITANANNIAHQREHLETLSKDMYDLTKAFGAGKPMYKIFCPMYNNDKGAYWLAETKEVKNPYFGQKMLTCGEVQEELK